MTQVTLRTHLYRLFGADGALLYVGISRSALVRLAQHLGDKPWADEVTSVSIQWFDSREEAAAAEVAAIVTEMPQHNIVHRARITSETEAALVAIGERRRARKEEERRLIRRAYAQGGGVREIARLTNLSHTHVARIVEGDDSPERD